MARVLQQGDGGGFWPAALVADTSVPREFYAFSDPAHVQGVALAAGDTWWKTAVNPSSPITYPPTYGPPGSYRPDATTTGVPDGTVLTTITGDVAPLAGAVYDSVQFDGIVTINVANVTFTRCRFTGGTAGDRTKWMVNCAGANCSGIVFNDCTFEPSDHTLPWAGLLGGHDWTANRCRFTGGIDSTDQYNLHGPNVNVVMSACLAEATDCFYPDPNHPDGSHCDNAQPTGGAHITIVGCRFTGLLSAGSGSPYYPQANSSIQLNQNEQGLSYMTIDRCWLDGGSVAALNISAVGIDTYGPMKHLTVTNNRFGRSSRVAAQPPNGSHAMQNWAIFCPTVTQQDSTNVISGNVYDDDGSAVTVHGG